MPLPHRLALILMTDRAVMWSEPHALIRITEHAGIALPYHAIIIVRLPDAKKIVNTHAGMEPVHIQRVRRVLMRATVLAGM